MAPAMPSCGEESLLSQLKLYDMILGMSKPMALRAAVLLNIPDIIADSSEGCPTLEEIASQISSSNENPPSIEFLYRVMRFLAAQEVFSEIPQQQKEVGDFRQRRYSLTGISRLLVKGAMQQNCVPLLLGSVNHITLPGWLHLHHSVLEATSAFSKAFQGMSCFEYTANIPEANTFFNDALSCHTRLVISSVVNNYDHGFNNITSLVDVGGGVGSALSIILDKYKHIKGINFDLPHVISAAPPIPGVEHVSGDMFEHIPPADAVFLKCVLHDWNDDDCVRLLKKCNEAIPKNGKIIVVDAVIGEKKGDEDEEDNALRSVGLAFDLEMMVFSNGGKERSEMEFRNIFSRAGFENYTIIKSPSVQAIIELSKF